MKKYIYEDMKIFAGNNIRRFGKFGQAISDENVAKLNSAKNAGMKKIRFNGLIKKGILNKF